MPKAEDIIKTALAEVGTTEYPPNSNHVKYNNDYYGGWEVSGSDYPWCCAFVWWIFNQHKPCLIKKTARCTDLGDWFKNQGRFFQTPQTGDIVFFKFPTNNRWTNHVGIVTKISGSMIETIEGNTSISNQDNGGAVMQRKRYSNIVGYGRPAYDIVAPVQPIKYQRGIDVSAYQGMIDFEKVKAAGVSFVCMRSVKKDGTLDQYFERNLSECIKYRLDYSCYRYSYAMDQEQARAEAQSVIRILGRRKMMIWYDMEDKSQIPLGKTGIEKIAEAFAQTCRAAGFEVGIYCNLNWYQNYMSDIMKSKYRFWIARYGKNTGQLDEKYKPSGKNIFAWQYTSKGSVPGINGSVDLDVIL
ncbi:MAG: CHAP domain-containing protein [Lachnospiraceae bacterium]|nr:CHAP domain-containing protein [Lachnospiraceae bacterium]